MVHSSELRGLIIAAIMTGVSIGMPIGFIVSNKTHDKILLQLISKAREDRINGLPTISDAPKSKSNH